MPALSALVLGCVLRAAAPEAAPASPVVEAPAAPWYQGVRAEVLGGFLAIGTPTDASKAMLDGYGGLRAGYSRPVWSGLTLGGEVALRGTTFANVGASPFIPQQLAVRLNSKPHQVVRQSNQLAAGGFVGWTVSWRDWFLTPLVLGGVSGSARTQLLELDGPLPYNLSYPSLGAYAGVGFETGLKPVFFRMEILSMGEVGPPPFTARVLQLQYNVGLGLRF